MSQLSSRLVHSVLIICCFCIVSLLVGCGRNEETLATVPSQPVLPSDTPLPTLHPLDATKQADNELHEQRRATAMARPTVSTYPTLIPEGTPYIPPGEIGFDCETAFLRLYDPGNCWFGLWNGQYLFFVAGSKPGNSDQGMIGLYISDMDGNTSDFETYLTPTQTGRVIVTQEMVPRFTVVSSTGITYVFDVETRKWESRTS
jgi:hypothetical protein